MKQHLIGQINVKLKNIPMDLKEIMKRKVLIV